MRFINVPNSSMVSERTINVEVVYATPPLQHVVNVTVPLGCTAREAIEQSNILSRFDEIDLTKNKVGIYGRLVCLDVVLQDGDRVEIYRPLKADPKKIRRLLAKEGKAMGKKKHHQGPT